MDTLRTTSAQRCENGADGTTWTTVDRLDICIDRHPREPLRVGVNNLSATMGLADLVHDRLEWAATERRAAVGNLFAALGRGLLRQAGRLAQSVSGEGTSRGSTERLSAEPLPEGSAR